MTLCDPGRRRTTRGARGQATVEFALLIPLVVIIFLALLQVALVAYAQLAVTHTAREVARSIVVDPTVDVGQIANSAGLLEADDLEILVSYERPIGADVVFVLVAISYEVRPISGIFGAFLDDFRVHAQVKMLVEP